MSLANPSIDDFQSWVGNACTVTIGDQAVEMRLAAAEPLEGSQRDAGGFRLEFRGPAEPLLEQCIAAVTGPDDTHHIFIVPIARDERGAQYEAVFF